MNITATLTCFNREKHILKALESLRNQSKQFFEVVICDDASTDSSVKIIKEFIETNKLIHFKLITHHVNGGQNAALNSAISASSGDVICFLDSDDAWKPNVSEILSKYWNANTPNNIGIQYGWIAYGPRWQLEGCEIYASVLKQGFLSCLGTISIRRSVLNSILPLEMRPEISDRCQDDRICFELSKKTCVRVIPHDLLIYGGTKGNSASNKRNVALGWEVFFKEYTNSYIEKNLRAYLGFHFFRISLMYISAGLPIDSLRLLINSISQIKSLRDLGTYFWNISRFLLKRIMI